MRDRGGQRNVGRFAIIECPPTSDRDAVVVGGFERWATAFEETVTGAVERSVIVARLFGQPATRMEGSPDACAYARRGRVEQELLQISVVIRQ